MINFKNLYLLLFILIYRIGSNELRACSTNRSLIKFSDQTDYLYLYEIDTLAKVKLNDNLKPSSLEFKSEIRLSKQTDCDYILKFENIQYEPSYTKRPLSRYTQRNDQIKKVLENPFHFKIVDGEIKEPNFDFGLKDEKMNVWIEKLYENLLFNLQLPLSEDIEEEVVLSNRETFDQCKVIYQVKNRRKKFYAIKSTKSMESCLELKPSLVKKLLIASHKECNYLVKQNLLMEVHCLENNRANLLHVTQVINTKLKFLRTEYYKERNRSTTKLVDQMSTGENAVELSKHLLNEICVELRDNISSKITQPLVKLGRNVRMLNYDQLIELAEYSNQIDECKNRQQFKDLFNSLIFQQGNEAAIRYLLDQVEQPIDMFYSLLAFSERPGEATLKLILPKLKEQLNKIDISYQPILGITAFLGNYCANQSCEGNELIIELQQNLVNRLGAQCTNKQHQILWLKSIQNIGLLDRMVDQVLPCLEQQEPTVRLATIQLFSTALDRSTINGRAIEQMKLVFANENEASELRINAFLILMKAMKFGDWNLSRNHLINYMMNQLQSEQNWQVLSFVDSYFKNMKDNSYGLNEMMNLIPKAGTKNPFLYSKNIYVSPNFLKNDLLNGELEINLIRNNQMQLVNGYLKGTIALTSEERQSIEVGVMQTGLNRIIDKFINEFGKKSANLPGTFQEMLRLMISMRQDKESIRTILDTMDETTTQQIKLITYLNLNGKTIFLVDYSDDNKGKLTKVNKIRRSIDTEKILSEDFERVFAFIYLNRGYELSNPLSPIKFEMTGVMIFGLKFNNRTFAPTFINDLQSSVEIGSKQEHKLKAYSGLNISPTFNYTIRPVDRDYIFDLYMQNDALSLIKSTTFLGEESAQKKIIKQTTGSSMCTSNLSHFIGVELCIEDLKNMNQPLQKLIVYELYIKKTDESLKTWQGIFKFEKKPVSKEELYNIVILFDTPGSKLNRHFSSKVQLNKSSKNIALNSTFSNQIQKYSANLNIDTTDLNNLKSKAHLYSSDQLFATVDFIQTVQHFKTKSEYKPSLRVFIAPIFNKPTIHLTGSLVFDLIKKNSLQFGLYSKTTNIQYLKGSIKKTVQNEKYLAEVLVNLPELLDARLHSAIQYSANQHLSTETKLDYVLHKMKLQDTIKMSTKYRNTSFNSLTGIQTFMNLRCSKHSDFNFDIAYNLTYRANAFLENDFKFQHHNIKELNLFQRYTFNRLNKNSKSFNCENILKFNLQPQQLTYQSLIALTYYPTDELFQYKFDFNLDKILNQLAIDLVKFNFDYQQVSKKPLKSYLKTSLQYKSHLDMSYKDELEEVAKNQYRGQIIMKWSRIKFINFDYNYLIRNEIIGRFYEIKTDFQMHHMPDPYSHVAVFESQKNNFTFKSLFRIKDKKLWNFKVFNEYRKQFNLTLESDYLNIRNNVRLSTSAVVGDLLIDANKFVYFDHKTHLTYSNLTLFEFNSLTINRRSIKYPKLLANLTIDQQPKQLKLNLKSILISSIKLNYNDYDQIQSGQFEILDDNLHHKSTWTMNLDKLHLKMKTIRSNAVISSLVLLSENFYNTCDLKATYYKWNLNANSKFVNEGRKLAFIKLNHDENPIVDHNTNISIAVTNGYINSVTYRDRIKTFDFDASIQGRDTSKVTLFVKESFRFTLTFNPFIKNKFADLEIREDEHSRPSVNRYLKFRFQHDPRSFDLETNYINEKFTLQKSSQKLMLKMNFKNLKFLGRCSHLIHLNDEFKQYVLIQFAQNDSTIKNNEFDLKFVSKKEFTINLNYDQLFKWKSELRMNDNKFLIEFKRQPHDLKFGIITYNHLWFDYRNDDRREMKLYIDSDDEHKLRYVRVDPSKKYSHATNIVLYKKKLTFYTETFDQFILKLNYELWQTFTLFYKKPDKEMNINLIRNQRYYAQMIEGFEIMEIELKNDSQKVLALFIKNKDFIHQSNLIYNEPTKVYLIKLHSNFTRYSTSSSLEKVLNCKLFLSKINESQLAVDYYRHKLSVKLDPFVEKRIHAIYSDENRDLLSSTEFAYLGPQTYHLYSNITIEKRMPFKFALISAKKKPTQLIMMSDNWHLNGEFNFFKLNKQTGVIKIRNDVENYNGNITLEANRRTFLIANYILLDGAHEVRSRANLTIAMMSSEIMKFNFENEDRLILTQLLWLGDRIVFKSEVNHTDYTHLLNGVLSYDPSKTVKFNFNKTYNDVNTFEGRLLASLTKPSYLYVDQLNFGNLNISADFANRQNQKLNLNYVLDDQTVVLYYLKQNSKVDSDLKVNMQKFHPLLHIDSSLAAISPTDSAIESKFVFFILETDYRTNIYSKLDYHEDGIVYSLNTDSASSLLPEINCNFTLTGLSTKIYSMNTYWSTNRHRLVSTYHHKELVDLEYNKSGVLYQIHYVKKERPIHSFVKRIVNRKATILSFDFENSDNTLNASIALEHLSKKTAFVCRKLNELIFEIIFDDSRVYDLRIKNINNSSISKQTITLNNPYISRPILVDFEKMKNDLSLKWNFIENQTENNQIKVDFRNLEFNEMYKIVKTIVWYNGRKIVGVDLEKNLNKNDQTRLNVNFFKSFLKLEDTHDKLIFNLNGQDLSLQVNKEIFIKLESQLKANNYSRKIVVYYDVKSKAISYQDFDLESLRNITHKLIVKPISFQSVFISILNTKNEIDNEIFLFHINTTHLNRRKFVLKHNDIYLFSKQFIKKQRKLINGLWENILLGSNNQKFTIETYLANEITSSFYDYGKHLKADLNNSFNPLFDDWPVFNNLIDNFNQNFIDTIVVQVSNFVENLINRSEQKINAFMEHFQLIKEYMIELFNVAFESFEDKFLWMRKFVLNKSNSFKQFVDQQIQSLKSSLPDDYWSIINNLWTILLSTDFWQSKFPIISSNLISFYF